MLMKQWVSLQSSSAQFALISTPCKIPGVLGCSPGGCSKSEPWLWLPVGFLKAPSFGYALMILIAKGGDWRCCFQTHHSTWCFSGSNASGVVVTGGGDMRQLTVTEAMNLPLSIWANQLQRVNLERWHNSSCYGKWLVYEGMDLMQKEQLHSKQCLSWS